MKIQIYSRKFPPAIGGMERLNEMLAREFVALGHTVHVVTETATDAEFPFPVHRHPGFLRYLFLARGSDVILSAPLSLKRVAAQLLSGRKLFISHPDRIGGVGVGATGIHAPLSFIKRKLSDHLVNIVPSRFMARFFKDAHVILNPYDDRAFYPPPPGTARHGVIFVGRLDEPKGCHLLIDAFARIAAEFPDQYLTIAGGGPQADDLSNHVAGLALADRVRFVGVVRGDDLTHLMQDHAVMVVPSIMEEPFGIVALEGLACGCRMVVSRTGGLPEAVGPFGSMFRSGDVADLATCLRAALRRDVTPAEEEEIKAYLADFQPARVASRFLALLSQGTATPR